MAYNAQLLDGMLVFAAVVNAGSFTQAAENTGHSTSYISKEINKLEQRLGLRLMNRTTRSLSLTPEGDMYFQQCEQIIAEAEQSLNALSGQQSEPTGLLRISCPASFGEARMQPVFADFLDRYPLVELELDVSNRKVDMIAEGFDVVLRATPQLEDSSLISRRIMRSRGVTIATPDYLQRHGTPVRPEELDYKYQAANPQDRPGAKLHNCICYGYLKQPRQWHYKNQYGKETQIEVASRVTTNSSEMILSLCLAGQGIARIPKFLLSDQLESGELVELFADHQHLLIDIFLIYPSRKHMSPKVRAFIDFVAETLSD